MAKIDKQNIFLKIQKRKSPCGPNVLLDDDQQGATPLDDNMPIHEKIIVSLTL